MLDWVKGILSKPAPSKQGGQHRKRGNDLLDRGEWGQAAACYRQAIAAAPDDLDAWINLGFVLMQQRQYSDAQAALKQALALDAGSIDALYMLGGIAQAQGDPSEAAQRWQQLLSLKPDFETVYGGLCQVLFESGQAAQARAVIEQGLARWPQTALFHYHLGNLHAHARQHDAAIGCFTQALLLDPQIAEAHNNLGAALQAVGRPEPAIESFRKALASKPDFAEALFNCGNALVQVKRWQEAVACYDRLLQLKPQDVRALSNRGTALSCAQRHEEAADAFSRVLAVEPDFPYALGHLFGARIFCCDWSRHADETEAIERAVKDGKQAIAPFTLLAAARSAAIQLDCAKTYAAEKYPPQAPLWNGERYLHEKIRVAYLSADFHDHATAYLMAELFELHDRTRFELTAISFGPSAGGEMRRRLQRSFDRFDDVREKTDREIALLLREREIDIAVDLKGFTTDSRMGILAHRAAPVQVSYLGYPGTLGVDYIDYILADRHVIPAEHRQYYSEKVVWLPDTYQVNDSKRRIAGQKPTRAECGLPPSGFVFCCFNNNYKITPDVFDCWMRLLDKTAGSVLWLLEDNPAASRNLRMEAAKRGVHPERLIFAPRMELDRHLARHQAADLFLDTLPCNAHTTASDALWAGLPLLTCAGETFAGRVAASLLMAARLPELVARDLGEYEAIALKLAGTPAMLEELRGRLARDRASAPLFDAGRFCRHLEQAYRVMWERQQRGEAPDHFAIDPA